MELRFVKGDFEHGKFKLQFRNVRADFGGNESIWQDVPCVEEEKEWCCHCKKVANERAMSGNGWGFLIPDDAKFCPICGSKRPK